MKRFLKHWPEILVFGAILAVLLVCVAPGMTWINTDSDGPHYILSAKYMGVAHNTSAPLFLLLGRLFLFLPFGTDAFKMGLISVLATTICSVLIYLSVKRLLFGKPRRRAFAIIAALIYGSSALVISQSTIIESYSLATMFMVAAYYMTIKRKWMWSSVFIGLTWAVHTLFGLTIWIVMFIQYRELRNLPMILLTVVFLGFYAYVPIATKLGNVPSMWGNSTFFGFLKNNFGTMWLYVGGLSIYDIPKRIIDTSLMLLYSFGFGTFVLIWYYIKKRTVKDSLLWLTLFSIIFFICNLSAETYVYMITSIAFGSIAIGVALSKLNVRWAYVTAAVAIALMGFNANYFDIGRTLDPNLSAQKYYDEELTKLSDDDIYLGGGWTWAIVYLYNKENGTNITSICTDVLPSTEYLDILESNGIKLTRTDSENWIDKQWLVAKSIAEQNDNVWISKEIIPSQYEYEIVPAKENMELITRWFGKEVEPQIAWKPSNPYKFITGALEVEEWKFIVLSNHNIRFAIICISFTLGAYVLVLKYIDRRKAKNNENKVSEQT